jgi:hypothetical protein
MHVTIAFFIGAIASGFIALCYRSWEIGELRKGVGLASAFAAKYEEEFDQFLAAQEARVKTDLRKLWEKTKAKLHL